MDAGQLDRRIQLQRKQEEDDGYATEAAGWLTFATVWAQRLPVSGVEQLAAGQVAGFNRARWKIRRDSLWSDLNSADRLRDILDDRDHNILSVRTEGRSWLVIDTAVSGDAA